ARQVGTFKAINLPSIKPSSKSANISFADNVITYNETNPDGAAAIFPTLDRDVVTSTPTLIITAATNTGQFITKEIQVDEQVRQNKGLNNLKITPGVRYNLKIRFGPCKEDIDPVNFSIENGNTKEFSVPATDDGLIFDVFTLDNSFTLRINNTPITTQEIQFQGGARVTPPRNVRFTDGGIWGDGNIPQIFRLEGDERNPIVRVVVSKEGKVSLYGSKTSGGPLYPLELFNNNTFNNVRWNESGQPNTINLSQILSRETYMSGRVRGRRIVQCQP
ncbi:hypothetical protein GNY06_02695, partial [Elizabethkingia argentiflava]|nr:hypothetical protein [Elizabethkingia argenteiflava]